MSAINSVANFVSDRANPVVVKELRQAVQSRLVIAILLLFLLANVTVTASYLTWSPDIQSNMQAGQNLFSMLFGLLVVTSMIFVPLYAAIRMTMERNNSNIDLLFITTIPAGAIIRGKFWSAAALTALIYSTCLPFLTLTYLLRGIDLPSIFVVLSGAFLATLLVIMLAVFVGSVSGGMLLRVLLGALLIWIGAWTMGMVILIGTTSVQFGFGSDVFSHDGIIGIGMTLASSFAAWTLLYLLSVAAVSAPSSNRMFPVRIFITISCFVLAAIVALTAYSQKDLDPIIAWVVMSTGVLTILMPVILCEREDWTLRVKRTIPRNFVARLLAWLLYTGSAGGLIWCGLLSILTLASANQMAHWIEALRASTGISSYSMALSDFSEILNNCSLVLLYSWCYCMSGLLARRWIVPKTSPQMSTVLAALLLGFSATIPLVFAYVVFDSRVSFDLLPFYYVAANPFVLMNNHFHRSDLAPFLWSWAVLVTLLNWNWFSGQWLAFRNHTSKAPPALEVPPEPAVIHG